MAPTGLFSRMKPGNRTAWLPGEAAVEFGLDERDHLHLVDTQAPDVTEERTIDVHAVRIDAAHHYTGQVGIGKLGASQVGAGDNQRTRPSGRCDLWDILTSAHLTPPCLGDSAKVRESTWIPAAGNPLTAALARVPRVIVR